MRPSHGNTRPPTVEEPPRLRLTPNNLDTGGTAWRPAAATTIIPVLLLLLLFGAALGSNKTTSPTYDEYEYLSRGYLHLKTADTRLKLRHPILLDGLAALPLLLLPDIQLPLEHPSLAVGDFHRYAQVFVWEHNPDLAEVMFFLGRMPSKWLLLLLVAGVYRWARSRFGLLAGLLAMTLAAFDPNLLAHGRLITPDIGQTTLMFFALFAWWRYWKRPFPRHLILAGILLGLAQTAGFPALILYPILFILTFVRAWRAWSALAGVPARVNTGPWWRRSVPTFAGITSWRPFSGMRDRRRFSTWLALFWHYFSKLTIAVGISLVVIWAVYRFSWGPVGPWGISLPAPYHWEELIDLFARLGRQDLAYLSGEVYRGGRFSFFIVALLVKTPIPTLLLMGAALFLLIKRRSFSADISLWLFPLLYYGNALRGSLNIGYRHILPMLPFMFVLAGAVLASKTRIQENADEKISAFPRIRASQFGRSFAALRNTQYATYKNKLLLALLAWLALASWRSYPHYLAYFNELAGGSEGGRQLLLVSDLDWGQDLQGLSHYLEAQAIETVNLSYFGTTPPAAYGISYRQLPAWPPRGNPLHFPFHPNYPLPGHYAISAANLMGARFEDAPDTFVWFQNQSPVAQIGHSILLYDVPRLLDGAAAPVDVALGGVALADLPPDVFTSRFHTNDLRLRWFNEQGAILIPAGATGWLVTDPQRLPPVLLEQIGSQSPALDEIETLAGDRVVFLDAAVGRAAVERMETAVSHPVYSPDNPTEPIPLPAKWDDTLSLIGYEQISPAPRPGEPFQILTTWRVDAQTEQPLAIFLHFLAPDGSILAQYDGLDALSNSWYPDDLIIQFHQMMLPENIPDGSKWLRLGLYRTDSQERLPLRLADQTVLDYVLIPVDFDAPQ